MALEGFQFQSSSPSHIFHYFATHIRVMVFMIFFFLIIIFLCFFFYRFVYKNVLFFSSEASAAAPSNLQRQSNREEVVVVVPEAHHHHQAEVGIDISDIISSLPIFMHRTKEGDFSAGRDGGGACAFGDQKECSICLGLFEDEEIVKVIPECLHAFHSACVDKWLSTRPTCPLCRLSLYTT